jgi:hypothetical protein
MLMHVVISEPSLLADLIELFRRNDCAAQRLGRGSCIVVHPHANHAGEALQEVNFFLSAWRIAHPGVSAAVTC